MNTIFKTLGSLGSSGERKEREGTKVTTSGKSWDWIQEKLTPMGLKLDTPTPYRFSVSRDGNVVGYYNTLTEIKEAIRKGYVHEEHNL